MKRRKFIPDYKDIPKKREAVPHLSIAERRGNFNEVELTFPEERAVSEASRCLTCRKCIGCGLCATVCPVSAIDYNREKKRITLAVEAVVLAPGASEFDAGRKKEFGYREFANVFTSLEVERMLDPDGPYGGLFLRASDGEIPAKVGIVLCVGSREEGIGAPYCSTICCNSALKQARTIIRRYPKAEITIFHRDIRTNGFGSEAYLRSLESLSKVDFIYGRITSLEEDERNQDIIIRYEDGEGRKERGRFSAVVLATGLRAPDDARKLASLFGIKLNRYRFAETTSFSPIETDNPRVVVAGTFTGPKGVEEAVREGTAAAAVVAPRLAREEIPSTKATGEETVGEGGVGVFICEHSLRHLKLDPRVISGRIRSVSQVSYVRSFPFLGDFLSTKEIKKVVSTKGFSRLILITVLPEAVFERRHFAKAVGFLEEAIFFVNPSKLRDEEEIVAKVEESLHLDPRKERKMPSSSSALVVGGGVAGLEAALTLSSLGHPVHLVAEAEELGGLFKDSYFTLYQEDVQAAVSKLISAVEEDPNIKIYLRSEVADVSKREGDFLVKLSQSDEPLTVGVILVATEGKVCTPTVCGYGKDPRVITQWELEEKLAKGTFSARRVAMIQCIRGSEDYTLSYCSRLCCPSAVKNALKIKELSPDTDVSIVHSGLRLFGFAEDYLEKAKEKGVRFFRVSKFPTFDSAEVLKLRFKTIAGEELNLSPDVIVLATGVLPSPRNVELAHILGLTTTKEGFIKPEAPLFPSLSASSGVFFAGFAEAPMEVRDAVVSGRAAGMKAGLFLRGKDKP